MSTRAHQTLPIDPQRRERSAATAGSDSLPTTLRKSPLETEGTGEHACVVGSYRIKPPKVQGDRYLVQARGRSGRWEIQCSFSSKAYAMNWVESRSPNDGAMPRAVNNQKI